MHSTIQWVPRSICCMISTVQTYVCVIVEASSSKAISLIVCNPLMMVVLKWNEPYTHRSYRLVGVVMWADTENYKVHLNKENKYGHSRLQKQHPERPEFYSYLRNDSLFSGITFVQHCPHCLSGYISLTNTSSALKMQPPAFPFTSCRSHSSSDISNHVSRAILSLSGNLPAE